MADLPTDGGDLSNYYTKSETDDRLNSKQNKLTAGDATDGIKIENGVIKLDPATTLQTLGYEEMPLTITDINNNVISVSVVGKVNATRGIKKKSDPVDDAYDGGLEPDKQLNYEIGG